MVKYRLESPQHAECEATSGIDQILAEHAKRHARHGRDAAPRTDAECTAMLLDAQEQKSRAEKSIQLCKKYVKENSDARIEHRGKEWAEERYFRKVKFSADIEDLADLLMACGASPEVISAVEEEALRRGVGELKEFTRFAWVKK